MAYDCAAAQLELNAMLAARTEMITGKRLIGGTYGDQAVQFAQISLGALISIIKEKEAEMLANGCVLTSGKAAGIRFAQPSLGDGRCRY